MIRSSRKKNTITGIATIAKINAIAPALHSERKIILSFWLLFIEASYVFYESYASFFLVLETRTKGIGCL